VVEMANDFNLHMDENDIDIAEVLEIIHEELTKEKLLEPEGMHY
jgi:hypothetical protein